MDLLDTGETVHVDHSRTAELNAVAAPPSPKRFFTVIGVVLGILVAIAVGLLWARAVFFSPDAAVRGYITALEQRDITSAIGHLDQPAATVGQPLAQPEIVQDTDYTPPDDLVVQTVDVTDDFATVTATMRLSDTITPVTFHLRRDSAAVWRLFRPWRIVDGLDRLGASWPYQGGITVAGKSFPTYDLSSLAFPGSYLLTPGTSALVEAPPVTISLGQGDSRYTEFAPTIKKTAQDDTQAQVTSYLDTCAKQPTFQPPGCPFSVYESTYGNPTNIAWTITTQPSYQLAIGAAGQLSVSSSTPTGQATVTWQTTDSYTKRVTQDSDSTTFGVSGLVYESAGKAVFQPRSAG